MFRALLSAIDRLLGAPRPAAFACARPVAEAVTRLEAAAVPPMLRAPLRQALIGAVSASHVALHRSRPLVSNAFKPWFFGAFTARDGGAVLAGEFSVHPFARNLTLAWTGLAAAWTLLTVLSGLYRGGASPVLLATGPAAIAIGVVAVLFGRLVSRNDPRWIAARIEMALAGGGGAG